MKRPSLALSALMTALAVSLAAVTSAGGPTERNNDWQAGGVECYRLCHGEYQDCAEETLKITKVINGVYPAFEDAALDADILAAAGKSTTETKCPQECTTEECQQECWISELEDYCEFDCGEFDCGEFDCGEFDCGEHCQSEAAPAKDVDDAKEKEMRDYESERIAEYQAEMALEQFATESCDEAYGPDYDEYYWDEADEAYWETEYDCADDCWEEDGDAPAAEVAGESASQEVTADETDGVYGDTEYEWEYYRGETQDWEAYGPYDAEYDFGPESYDIYRAYDEYEPAVEEQVDETQVDGTCEETASTAEPCAPAEETASSATDAESDWYEDDYAYDEYDQAYDWYEDEQSYDEADAYDAGDWYTEDETFDSEYQYKHAGGDRVEYGEYEYDGYDDFDEYEAYEDAYEYSEEDWYIEAHRQGDMSCEDETDVDTEDADDAYTEDADSEEDYYDGYGYDDYGYGYGYGDDSYGDDESYNEYDYDVEEFDADEYGKYDDDYGYGDYGMEAAEEAAEPADDVQEPKVEEEYDGAYSYEDYMYEYEEPWYVEPAGSDAEEVSVAVPQTGLLAGRIRNAIDRVRAMEVVPATRRWASEQMDAVRRTLRIDRLIDAARELPSLGDIQTAAHPVAEINAPICDQAPLPPAIDDVPLPPAIDE